MIRSVDSNFLGDYAVWRYPNLFTVTCWDDGYYSIRCSLCRVYCKLKSCKEVDAHAKIHVDEGKYKYCGH